MNIKIKTFGESCDLDLKPRGWLSLWAWFLGAFITFVLLTLIAILSINASFTGDARSLFLTDIERAIDAIEDKVKNSTDMLEGAKGLLVASNQVDRSEWERYTSVLRLNESIDGVQGVGYSIFIDEDELDFHTESIRSEGFPDYTLKPSGKRDAYTSIIYLEPFDERNQQAFGYDMFSNPIRRAAMESARDTGDPHMSGRITLVQEIDADVQPGFLLYVPFYKNNFPHKSLKQKQKNIVGYVYSAFRARDFIESILGKEGVNAIGLSIYDGPEEIPEQLLYDDVIRKEIDVTKARFIETRTIIAAGRTWTLTFVSSPDFGASVYSRFILVGTALVGLIISLLFMMIFYTLHSSRSKALLYAEEVTVDLRAAKAKDKAILSSIGEGLVATDNDGRIVMVNSAFESLLGWKGDEIRGKKLSDVLEILDSETKEVLSSEALQDDHNQDNFTNVYLYKRKDGSSFPVSVIRAPIVLEKSKFGVVELFRDITEELAVDRAKTEFVSLASHQLRTPLSAINWHAEMLLDGDMGELSAPQKKGIEFIYEGNQRMVMLVHSLLNVSRLEMGTFGVVPVLVEVPELSQKVLANEVLRIKEKKLKIVENYSKGISKFNTDYNLLAMVLNNLVTNAIKYSNKSGKVSIVISMIDSGEVSEISSEQDLLCIEVCDNGYGIPKEQQPFIFDKLFRADNVKEKDTDGTGLGLYIVKSIVETLGGVISFESEKEKGASFRVVLPEV